MKSGINKERKKENMSKVINDTSKELLNKEFDNQIELLSECETIILYGRSVLTPMIYVALDEIGVDSSKIRLFEKGEFVDGLDKDGIVAENTVVLICAMRQLVIDEIRKSSEIHFPQAKCFDIYAIYYYWSINCCRRNCDSIIFADTLVAARNGQVFYAIDCINTLFCNLNCKDCSNGIPLRKKKEHIPEETQINSLSIITGVRPICNCNIQGGEPLLYPDIAHCINSIAENPRIAFITLATNGTIIPKENILDTLRKSGAIIRISDYGKLSKKKEELSKTAFNYNIPCAAYYRAERWCEYGEYYPRCRPDDKNLYISKHCFFGTNDIMLCGDKLFCCCRSLYADAMGKKDSAVSDNTLVLSEINFDAVKISSIFEGKNLYKMCDFCDFPMREIDVAKQI